MTYVGPCTFKWVKLAMRKWVIGYASGNQEVVQGAGVVGLYPVLGGKIFINVLVLDSISD